MLSDTDDFGTGKPYHYCPNCGGVIYDHDIGKEPVYNVINTLPYTVAKHEIETHGGKCSYDDGDLIIEYPGKQRRRVAPVYIQDDGWRFPLRKLGLLSKS